MDGQWTKTRFFVRYTSGHRAAKRSTRHPCGDSHPLPNILAHARARRLRMQGAEARIEEVDAMKDGDLF